MTETTPVGVSCNMASLLHKIISLYRANWNVRMRHVLEKKNCGENAERSRWITMQG